jgi:hypothetical protein
MQSKTKILSEAGHHRWRCCQSSMPWSLIEKKPPMNLK